MMGKYTLKLAMYIVFITLCLTQPTLSKDYMNQLAYIKDYPDAVKLLSEYVSFPSVTGNEKEAGEFLAGVSSDLGLHITVFSDEKDSYNFAASLYPLSSKKPNIIFLNHIDVVPAGDSNAWIYPPFSGAVKDSMVWGRGSIDNKAMGVMQLLAIASFVEMSREKDLPFNFTLLSVSNEEKGGKKGAKIVVDNFLELLNPVVVFGEGGVGIKGLISSDPELLFFGITIAQKRGLWLKLTSKTPSSGHGSVPREVYPNKELIKALNLIIVENKRKIQITKPSRLMFKEMGKLEGGMKGLVLKNIDFFKPFVKNKLKTEPVIYAMLSNTITLTNLVNQDGAINQIASESSAILDCRLLPNTKTKDFINNLRHLIRNTDVSIEIIKETPPGGYSVPDEFYEALKSSIFTVYGKVGIGPIIFPANNDNNYFRSYGVPAFGIIPVFLENELIESIHNVNERMPVKALNEGEETYRQLIFNILKNIEAENLNEEWLSRKDKE